MRRETSSPDLINLGMLCVAVLALLFSYRSSEYARISAETARASSRFQSMQIRPQLDYALTKVSTTGDVLHFTISAKNLGPTTAMIYVVQVPVHSEGNGTWFLHFLEGAVIPNGQSREAQMTIPRLSNFGGKLVDVLSEIKALGGLTIEVRFSANGLPEETYSDSRRFPIPL